MHPAGGAPSALTLSLAMFVRLLMNTHLDVKQM